MKMIRPNFLRVWPGSKGAFGMVHAPGKIDELLCAKRNLRKDLVDLRKVHSMDVLVSLLEVK